MRLPDPPLVGIRLPHATEADVPLIIGFALAVLALLAIAGFVVIVIAVVSEIDERRRSRHAAVLLDELGPPPWPTRPAAHLTFKREGWHEPR